jgi:broad specificity phosphatase PhoE
MEIYLLRHAASLRRTLGVWGRLFDADLDSEYLFQLDNAKTTLSNLAGRTVFSSPLSRCLQSGRFIFGPDEPLIIVPELRAYHSGVLEDKHEEYVRTHYPLYIDKTFKERFTVPQFGEESMAAQALRVRKGLRRILEAGAENVVVITHYSAINIIAGLAAFDFDTSRYAEGKVDVVEGGLVKLTLDRSPLLRALADVDGDD